MATNRKSCSIEENARDLLLGFLEGLNRKPLRILLSLALGQKMPNAFQNLEQLKLAKEVQTINSSRADLVISAANSVLCVEVKVDAAEQLGQYIKYREFFRSEGKDVYVVGLINRLKGPAARKDDEPFFEFEGIRRILWSELLDAFENECATSYEFKLFRKKLEELHSGIGGYSGTEALKEEAQRDCSMLAEDNQVLLTFYRDLIERFPGWEGHSNRYGNSPFEIHLGKPQWARLFHEHSCRRLVVALNQPRAGKLHSQPYLALCVILWNQGWFKNKEWFLDNHRAIAAHFHAKGFQVVRNQGSSWHRYETWLPPFENLRGLKYVNAFWEHKFSLVESEYCKLGWEVTLDRMAAEVQRLAEVIDSLQKQLRC